PRPSCWPPAWRSKGGGRRRHVKNAAWPVASPGSEGGRPGRCQHPAGLTTTTLSRRIEMAEDRCRRVGGWVQHMGDLPHLMLQWHDPETGKRKSRSAQTCNPLEAEKARADLEYELNHGLYQGGSRTSWESFREAFEREYVAPLRDRPRVHYGDTLDQFER